MQKSIYFLVVLFLWSFSLNAQTAKEVDLEKLDVYFAQMVKDWEVPSASIGIVKDGKLVFAGNYGLLEEGKSKQPDKNSLYAIASNSKAFTAAIIGMLVQEGKLNWNDKVKKYLPYFELYDPWVSSEITIRDILSHRVGLGTFSGDVIWYKSDLSSEEIIKRVKNIPKAYDFRAGYGYSNVMYITAGELIKKVTGKTWSENVQERIFNPLQMNRTVTNPEKLQEKGNFATPHARENEKNFPISWENWGEIAAMGGIISSVEDMSKWMLFNLNYGIIGKDTLLSKNSQNMVWTPHNNFRVDHTKKNDFSQHFNAYGLGWGLSDYHGRFRAGHTGGYDGMITAVTLIPDENLGVVVLTNGMKSPYMAATYYALDLFLEGESKDWSAELLEKTNKARQEDKRVSYIKENRVLQTKPTVSNEECAGVYVSDIYGKITIINTNNQLKMDFEHSSFLSANLTHWHYDVWEIKWKQKHAWFNFGTVKFTTDNNRKITGLEFEVPNDDIFFEELKPYRINSKNK